MPTPLEDDLRPLLFDGCSWYPDLEEATDDLWVLWRTVRSDRPSPPRDLLIAAAAFAREVGVLDEYRARLESIPVSAFSDASGEAHNRSPVSPIWQIANELIVGAILGWGLGWSFLAYEPKGHRDRIGEWEFESLTGRPVFVEVKTLVEPARYPAVFNRGPATSRLAGVLGKAYRQLPRDGRATLVVLVGDGLILSASPSIALGDLFQTLFGEIQITFQVLPYVEGSERIGPAFREMFVQPRKHRRLGAVAAVVPGGFETPGLGYYVIHNPFADEGCGLTPEDFPEVSQFVVNESGVGEEREGINGVDRWGRIVRAAGLAGSS